MGKLIIAIIVILIIGLRPTVGYNQDAVHHDHHHELLKEENFVLIEEANTQIDKKFFLGKIHSVYNGSAANCDYQSLKTLAAEKAKMMGGNCLVIRVHEYPNFKTNCHKITAVVYKVSQPKKNDITIEWNEARKLVIADFTIRKSSRQFQALTASSIHTHWRTRREQGIMTLETKALFHCKDSYFIRSERDDEVLSHEQLHFDITEIYRRKYVKRILEEANDYRKFERKNKRIFDQVFAESERKQNEYDAEVYVDPSQQNKWFQWVHSELMSLEAYKMTKIDLVLN